MSLDLYSSLLQPHQSASAQPPPPPPPKSKPPPPDNPDSLSAVEQRLLHFFPTALSHATHTHTTPPHPHQPPAQPHQTAPAQHPTATKPTIPATPKLLSALHCRTPSISPFARMGLDWAEDAEGGVRTAGGLKEADEVRKEAEEVAGVSGRDVKQATAELVYATRQRRSTLRGGQMAHARPASLSVLAHKADEPATPITGPAPAIVEQSERGRRIISNVRMMNAANRPVLHNAAPLAPNSPLSPPQPVAVSQPTSPLAEPVPREEGSNAQAKNKRQPSAFLSQLAGLIKTPMTAAPPSIPRYHAAAEAAADAQQPASPTAATAAASIEHSRAAAAAAQKAAKQATQPTSAQPEPSKQTAATARAMTASQVKQTDAASKAQSAVETSNVNDEEKKHDTPAAATTGASPAIAMVPATLTRPGKQAVDEEHETPEKPHEEDEDSWDDSEESKDSDDSSSSDSSSDSDSTLQRIASTSDSDSDPFMRSLSSMWTTAKRRQDKQLAREQRQAAERTEQQRLYGKTLVNGGVIVEREGGRIKKELRRAVRSGRQRDGAKLTLEERKAMKMAAVYIQQGQTVKKAAVKAEEKREQEEPDGKPHDKSHTPPSTARALPAPASNRLHSSPSSPRRRTAPPTSTPAPFIPVRYDAPAMPAEPLPARLPTDVAFGRNTALTADEAARRTKKAQRRGPSLFDLAYGTAAVEAGEADKVHKKKPARSIEEEDDTELPHASVAPVVLPASVSRVSPPVSSYVISEGVAAGLPFSIRTIKRRTTASAAVVPADADVAGISQQAIRQHKHNAPPPSTAINASTLSHKAASFSRAPRSPQPSKPTQPTPAAQPQQQPQPAKRPRMAAKTKAHLDRLHAAHLAQQQRLQRERLEKEERALDGCTFVPQLAARSEKMAERKRMQDEVQMRLYDVIKARKNKDKDDKRGDDEAEAEAQDDAPITWGWKDADQPSPAPIAAADGLSPASLTSATTPASSSAGKREKLSRAEVMYAQHRIQQERLRELKQMEDEQKAQKQLAQCTFVPHTNHYGSPSSDSHSTHPDASQNLSGASASPVGERRDEQPQPVPTMVVQKMHTSYDEQFVRDTSRRQSHETTQPQQPAQSSASADEPSKEAEVDEEEDDLFGTAEAPTARSAAPPTAPLVAPAHTEGSVADTGDCGIQSSKHAVVTAWAVPDDGAAQDDIEADDDSEQRSAEPHGSSATEGAGQRDSIHTSFAWAVPAFATDTGEDELESPVHAYPEVVEVDDWQRQQAGETDEELDELLNTTELAQFRHTLLAEQMHVAEDETIDTAPAESIEEPIATDDTTQTSVPRQLPMHEHGTVASATECIGDDTRALLYVDIALSADRVERMRLCDGDDLLRCASDFCAKHDLHADYVETIARMLQQRLQES